MRYSPLNYQEPWAYSWGGLMGSRPPALENIFTWKIFLWKIIFLLKNFLTLFRSSTFLINQSCTIRIRTPPKKKLWVHPCRELLIHSIRILTTLLPSNFPLQILWRRFCSTSIQHFLSQNSYRQNKLLHKGSFTYYVTHKNEILDPLAPLLQIFQE